MASRSTQKANRSRDDDEDEENEEEVDEVDDEEGEEKEDNDDLGGGGEGTDDNQPVRQLNPVDDLALIQELEVCLDYFDAALTGPLFEQQAVRFKPSRRLMNKKRREPQNIPERSKANFTEELISAKTEEEIYRIRNAFARVFTEHDIEIEDRLSRLAQHLDYFPAGAPSGHLLGFKCTFQTMKIIRFCLNKWGQCAPMSFPEQTNKPDGLRVSRAAGAFLAGVACGIAKEIMEAATRKWWPQRRRRNSISHKHLFTALTKDGELPALFASNRELVYARRRDQDFNFQPITAFHVGEMQFGTPCASVNSLILAAWHSQRSRTFVPPENDEEATLPDPTPPRLKPFIDAVLEMTTVDTQEEFSFMNSLRGLAYYGHMMLGWTRRRANVLIHVIVQRLHVFTMLLALAEQYEAAMKSPPLKPTATHTLPPIQITIRHVARATLAVLPPGVAARCVTYASFAASRYLYKVRRQTAKMQREADA